MSEAQKIKLLRLLPPLGISSANRPNSSSFVLLGSTSKWNFSSRPFISCRYLSASSRSESTPQSRPRTESSMPPLDTVFETFARTIDPACSAGRRSIIAATASLLAVSLLRSPLPLRLPSLLPLAYASPAGVPSCRLFVPPGTSPAILIHMVEESLDVRFYDVVHLLPLDRSP